MNCPNCKTEMILISEKLEIYSCKKCKYNYSETFKNQLENLEELEPIKKEVNMKNKIEDKKKELLDEIKKKNSDYLKAQKINLLRRILSIVVFVAFLVLCFLWFDYKLFIVIFLLVWANNMSRGSN